ncbi:MAG: hypothetical protein MI725_10460 [Pirellulales bacterium]|nr:hypothetical protein [Pirellulales bacterium]
MRIFSAATLSFSLVFSFAGIVKADLFTYDFSGTLGNHFHSTTSFDPLVQSGGQINYDNGNLDSVDDTEGLLANITPEYSESWVVSIDAGVPTGYENAYVDAVNQEDYLAAGIVVFYDFMSGNEEFAFEGSLEITEGQRNILSSADSYNPATDTDTLFSDAATPTNALVETLSIRFDSDSKVLSLIVDGVNLHSIDTDAPATDWGMGENDAFQIAIFGTSQNEAVSSAAPLTLDNYALQFIPEPSTILLAVAAGLANILYRQRR